MKTLNLVQVPKEIPKEDVRVEVRECNLIRRALRSD
jgi:hypothetical protein